ncbi:uncharacterized protein LOC128229669 [Mya arenaria]|uniref:uncharacterized protein LOC128229669 n=1 Tax=Mya arenaria TaxID=6604 RepID=UPI0022E46A98|nr:uncharacterized protein LOC128229669 [Mya arenaria]XP_052797407.1 uncharacterized protein LOC128229669 [Mya arenaria]XP_052797409.1 uncharacterized protein LOC128229669 [Mya arenaria]
MDGENDVTQVEDKVPREKKSIPVGRSSTLFAEYLEKTGVEKAFRENLHLLLLQPELPYNPYHSFSSRMKTYQEKFHLHRLDGADIRRLLDNELEEGYIDNLYTVKHYRNVWGTGSILKVINPDALEKYRWLINDITPQLDQLPIVQGYSNQCLVSLIGPAVFDGSFYPSVRTVQVRVEYIVSGEDVAQGVELYVSSVLTDIGNLYQSGHHFMIAVTIPKRSATNTWSSTTWNSHNIQNNLDGLKQAIRQSVKDYKYITVKSVFLLDPASDVYLRGDKQYGLNFIDIKDDGLESYCEFPMSSLHEGVFFERSHAEAFFSIFLPQRGASKSPEQQIPDEGQGATSANKDKDGSKGKTDEKVLIDGFQQVDKHSSGPFDWRFTTPLRGSYQVKIARAVRDVELFDVLYNIIILTLMDRDFVEGSEGVLVEVWRLLHGTYGAFYTLMEHNKALRALITGVAKEQVYPHLEPFLGKYLEEIHSTLLNSLLERSEDHRGAGKVVVSRVEDMILQMHSHPHYIEQILKDLRAINLYLVPLMMELAASSLQEKNSPTIRSFIQDLKEKLQDRIPEIPVRVKKRPKPKPIKGKKGKKEKKPPPEKNEAPVVEEGEYEHGKEDSHIHGHRTSVLPVATLIDRDDSPPAVVREAVLMKYMLDCHFDDMWNSFLIELAGGDVFPPNPFPRLTSILRQLAMKMELFYEKTSHLVGTLFNTGVTLEDERNHVYHIQGLNVHGIKPAMQMLDTGSYTDLADLPQVFAKLQQKSYIQKKGPYRVGICLALSGPGVWYGRMQPYLTEIEFHEHYYIQGPSGCSGEAIQLFSSIVYSHLEELITTSGLPVGGVYFGQQAPDHWSSKDILNKMAGFSAVFAQTCMKKQPIYAKAYISLGDWRFVTVTKYFKLHFLSLESEPELFYEENPAALYQSVFSSKERVTFHCQRSGLAGAGSYCDPLSAAKVGKVVAYIEGCMGECERRGDWLYFYRHLLLRDLVMQEDGHVADCWRMFHSIVGELEYLIGLVSTMQGLVEINMLYGEEEQSGADNPNTPEHLEAGSHAKNRVDQKAFSSMIVAFEQKLRSVCSSKITMVAPSLPEYIIDRKFKSAVEYDELTQEPSLAVEQQTIQTLEELKSMLQYLQDVLSSDVHSVLPAVTYHTNRLTQRPVLESRASKTPEYPTQRAVLESPVKTPDPTQRAYLVSRETKSPESLARSSSQHVGTHRRREKRPGLFLGPGEERSRPDSVVSLTFSEGHFRRTAVHSMTIGENDDDEEEI